MILSMVARHALDAFHAARDRCIPNSMLLFETGQCSSSDVVVRLCR
jgi:hypothetical protein